MVFGLKAAAVGSNRVTGFQPSALKAAWTTPAFQAPLVDLAVVQAGEGQRLGRLASSVGDDRRPAAVGWSMSSCRIARFASSHFQPHCE
jgi:hypothetical protein